MKIIVEAAILQEIYAYLGQEENSQTNSEILMLICPKGLKLMMEEERTVKLEEVEETNKRPKRKQGRQSLGPPHDP